MSIAIRDASLSDAPTITRFNALMALETENLTLDESRLLNGVRAVLQDPAKGFYCVAEMDGAVVGQLMITFEWSDWRNGTVLWIQSVYVLTDYRKKGVFKIMYNEIKKRVQSNPEYSGIRLYVDRTNEKAIRVYEAMGMQGEHYRLFEDMK